MRPLDKTRTAAEVLVDQLMINGVSHVFCVPGESYLAVLDAFHDRKLAVTVCRQEGGAAMMAEAVGKATGRPGICFVTRGPGATNASAGIHIAQQDSTPMIMFVGQVTRDIKDREALQELDLRAVFGSMTKWTAEIDDPARVPEIVSRAFYTATSGRPGPVVIGLPEDMLAERTSAAERARVRAGGDLARRTRDGKARGVAGERAAPLGGARRHPLVAGRLRRHPALRRALRSAGRHQLPAPAAVRSAARLLRRRPRHRPQSEIAGTLQGCRSAHADRRPHGGNSLAGLFPDGHSGAGHAARPCASGRRGARAGSTGRISPSMHRRPRLRPPPTELRPARPAVWRERTAQAHADYLAWTEVPTPQPGAVNLGAVMVWLRENLPTDAILCNGAGNYAAWIHRFYRFRNFATHIAPTSASMGYGMPSAVAMQRLYPDRTVVCLNGDGDFLMNGQEFATAVMYELPIVVIVADNGIYGTIRMHQERDYPGRVSGDLPAQSRLLRLCARLRRFRRHGRAHRGFRRRIPGGAAIASAGDHPRQDRSRGDYAGHDAEPDSRAGTGEDDGVIRGARSRLAATTGRPSN